MKPVNLTWVFAFDGSLSPRVLRLWKDRCFGMNGQVAIVE